MKGITDMAFVQLHVFSEVLGMQTEVYVCLPQRSTSGEIGMGDRSAGDKFKSLYLLHGLSDDQSIWMRRTSIERYAQDYGICVIMPCGAKSFYTDIENGDKYFTYITKELPQVIREFFNVSPKREDTFIAGNSMGGYGAMKAALRACDTFGGVAALSAVADIEAFGRGEYSDSLKKVFGQDINIPDEDNLFYLVKETEKNPERPRIYMCCGTEDFLYQDNLALKAELEKLDYDYTYLEAPGVHGWLFWDEHIQYALKWMFD